MCTILSCDIMVSFQNSFLFKTFQTNIKFVWLFRLVLIDNFVCSTHLVHPDWVSEDFAIWFVAHFHIFIFLWLSHLYTVTFTSSYFNFTFSYFHFYIFILLPVFLQMLDLANFPQQWTLWNFKLLTFKGICLKRCFSTIPLLQLWTPSSLYYV